MSAYIGNTQFPNVNAFYIGNTPMTSLYMGNQKFWPTGITTGQINTATYTIQVNNVPTYGLYLEVRNTSTGPVYLTFPPITITAPGCYTLGTVDLTDSGLNNSYYIYYMRTDNNLIATNTVQLTGATTTSPCGTATCTIGINKNSLNEFVSKAQYSRTYGNPCGIPNVNYWSWNNVTLTA